MSELTNGRGVLAAGGLAAILASTCCLGPLVLVTLGSIREVLGRGSLGGDLQLLFGGHGTHGGIHFFGEEHGFLLALLPPGAFILLGLMLAWRQAVRAKATPATPQVAAPPELDGRARA